MEKRKMTSVLAIIVLVLDIWAIIHIFQSSVEPLKKALWIVGVLLLPVIGFVVWFFLGPRSGNSVLK